MFAGLSEDLTGSHACARRGGFIALLRVFVVPVPLLAQAAEATAAAQGELKGLEERCLLLRQQHTALEADVVALAASRSAAEAQASQAEEHLREAQAAVTRSRQVRPMPHAATLNFHARVPLVDIGAPRWLHPQRVQVLAVSYRPVTFTCGTFASGAEGRG